MEKSVYQKDISCKMFDFLCEVVGSEKMIKKRRLFFTVMGDAMSNKFCTAIISGSKAEGLDMKDSDIDIMQVIHKVPIYQCQSQIDNIHGLIVDTENAAPGFVLLKVPYGNIPRPSLKYMYIYSEYGLLLPSNEFKQFFLRNMNKNVKYTLCNQSLKIHGPCISTLAETIDYACCLKSQTWPIGCMKWFYRPMCSKWPTANAMAKIAREGLLYVPIGSKFGSTNENSLEWRISFSVAENILIHSFNQTQVICYALLKIVLKEVINTNKNTTNLLCSYFMKTVVFWLAEESDPSSWNPETLLMCFQSCLDRLIYWVRIGYCPNYFLPEKNMFEGKVLQLINRSATLCKFLSYNIRYNVSGSEAIDKAIYPLLRWQMTPLRTKYQILQRIICHMLKGYNLPKSLYLLWLRRKYITMLECLPYTFDALNKSLYRCYKLLLSHCLIAKNGDVVCGGVILAAFFYRHKEYEKALSVTNYALQECTPDKYYLNFEEIGNINSNISFLQRYKLSCINYFHLLLWLQSVLSIKDLERRNSKFNSVISGPPNVLIHFIRFMCFHHLGNFIERKRCLVDIKLTLEEKFLTNDFISRQSGLYYWIKAVLISNNFVGLVKEYFQSKHLIKEALTQFLNY